MSDSIVVIDYSEKALTQGKYVQLRSQLDQELGKTTTGMSNLLHHHVDYPNPTDEQLQTAMKVIFGEILKMPPPGKIHRERLLRAFIALINVKLK